jgi:hypothetical protein
MKSALVKVSRNTTLVSVLLIGLQACGCDTSACVDGLLVKFDSAPTTPWKVELFANGVQQPAPARATCDGTTACPSAVLFSTSLRDGLSVRVTTGAGTKTTQLPRITYVSNNTRNSCADCTGNAEISVPIP